MKFEEAMKELESIVEKMESGMLSIDESLQMFSRGIELSKECKKQLQDNWYRLIGPYIYKSK